MPRPTAERYRAFLALFVLVLLAGLPANAQHEAEAEAEETTQEEQVLPCPDTGVVPEPEERCMYELQVGIYHREAAAQAFIDKMRSRDLAAYIVVVESSKGVPRYTVRIGPYASMAEAMRGREELRDRAGLESFVRYRTESLGS